MERAATEAGGLAGLPFLLAADLTACVEGVHTAVAGRSFAAVGILGRPVQAVHDGIAGTVYAAIRGSADVLGRAAVKATQSALPAGPVAATPAGALLVSALNGAFGDRLAATRSGLAIGMAIRSRGGDVRPEPAHLRRAFPKARPKLAVFVHGLCENENSWGGAGSYGERLEADLGYTPVYLRYNTGLHVSDNGQALDGLLAALLSAWPVPVAELALLGHSMGGLVIRSACEQGDRGGAGWVPLVKHVFLLGTPNLGAPLEKIANLGASLLRLVPETRPLGRLINRRSAGIKDLRFGALVEDDWRGRDPDALLVDSCTEVPLPAGISHHVVAATVTRRPDSPLGRVLGDTLVRYESAMGEGRRRRLAVEPGRRHHLGAATHFDLLDHPRVYDWIRGQLAS